MDNNCKYKIGSTRYLLYWQFFFLKRLDFKKFITTWIHIFNRKKYWEFKKTSRKRFNIDLIGLEEMDFSESWGDR